MSFLVMAVIYWKWAIAGFVLFVLWHNFDLSQRLILERREVISNMESEKFWEDMKEKRKIRFGDL